MEELNLKDLFILFWNRKIEIILITVIAVVIGTFYSYFYVTPQYSASTTLVLAQSSVSTESNNNNNNNNEEAITQTDVALNSKLVSTYSQIIKSKAVLRKVVDDLKIEGLNEDNLKRKINVKAVEDTEIIKITVTDYDAETATKIANKIAEVFSEKIVEIYNIRNVYILDRAETNTIPSNINHMKDLVVFGLIGIVISILVVLIISLLDTTIKTEQDIENCTGLLTLSIIPDYDQEKGRSKK